MTRDLLTLFQTMLTMHRYLTYLEKWTMMGIGKRMKTIPTTWCFSRVFWHQHQTQWIQYSMDLLRGGALPKSRQAYNNIIAQYEQNQNSSGSSNNSGGTPTPAKQASTGETKKQLSKSGKAYKFNKARRILEGFLRAHNTPNKELPPVGFKQVRFLEVKSFRSLHQHGTFGIPKMITHLLHPKVFP